VVTGIDVLRKTVHARNRSPHALGLLAREINIGASVLEAFAKGEANLDVATLQALTKVLFHQHAEYDPESGLLHSSNKEPRQPICGPGFPVRYDPEKAACYPPPFKRGAREGVQPARQGPQPLTAEPPPPPKTRPGWAVD